VEYVDGAGATGVIRADYVIGADGMHSIVREQAGIGFTGDTYPASFVLADVRMDLADRAQRSGTASFTRRCHRGRAIARRSGAEPLPRGGHRGQRSRTTRMPGYIQTVLDARGPGGAVKVLEVLWGSRFRVHHRVADHYPRGPHPVGGRRGPRAQPGRRTGHEQPASRTRPSSARCSPGSSKVSRTASWIPTKPPVALWHSASSPSPTA